MPDLDLDRLRELVAAALARWEDWYAEGEAGRARTGDWSFRDKGESLSHCLVRNDLSDLLDDLPALIERLELAEAQVKRLRRKHSCGCAWCCTHVPDGVERGATHERTCLR